MAQNDSRTQGEKGLDPRGQTDPPGGRDRSHDPQAQAAQQPGGGGAPETGSDDQGEQPSEEAKNQKQTGSKSRAETGTP